MSHYVHHVPGRLRIKVPQLKRNNNRAADLESLLANQDGILGSEINVLTGSVVINYDRSVCSAEQIMTAMRAERHLAAEAQLAKKPAKDGISGSVANVGDNIAKALMGFVVEKALERSATALIGAIL